MSGTQINPIINLLPLFIIYIILAICMLPIAKRKGKKPWLNIIICLIPLVNFFWIVYVCSLTDEQVKKDVLELKETIKRLTETK